MSIIAEFFVAPDDAAATSVLDAGPDTTFESVTYGDFDAWLAMPEWACALTGRSTEELTEADEPRLIAGEEGGSVVLAASRGLQDALAAAGGSTLVSSAQLWIQRQTGDGEDFDPEQVRDIFAEVARLARAASITGQSLYCWMG